jgi:benzoate-CoA ligase family protein
MAGLEIPERYNASTTFIDDNLKAGRGNNPAILYGNRILTYSDVAALVNRTGNALIRIGVQMEQRVMLLLLDSPEFAAGFFGAIRIGAVPVPTNTMLRPADYEYLLNDSRAVALMIHESLWPNIEPIRKNLKWLKHIIIVGSYDSSSLGPPQTLNFTEWVKEESDQLEPVDTSCDDICFWLYSSGTTGFPKAAVHLQHDMAFCAENYARGVLNISEKDSTYTVASLFFAYGLGNGLYFPFYVGGTTILSSARPEPKLIYEDITRYRPSLFFCVPTAYAALLDYKDTSGYDLKSVRQCVSAGEALPKNIFKQWQEKWGLEILDGIGSTEVLHIFISNRAHQAKAGSSGKLVPGYEARIVDEEDRDLSTGKVGNLLVSGDSICAYYWNRHKKTQETIVGEWIRTGDKYLIDEEGYFWFQGRSDDMLKAEGIWVSPVEVEEALILHPAVLECAVIDLPGKDSLVRPKAFVVLKQGFNPSPELEYELKSFVKNKIGRYKYPRWVEFLKELPKTASGKILRFRLRQQEAARGAH